MRSRVWDACAIGLSSMCLVHCLMLPLGVAVLPSVSRLSDNQLVHIVLVLIAAPVTLWVVWGVLAHGGSRTFVAIALSGLALMSVAVGIPQLEVFETQLTLAGGLLLAGAHLWRWFSHGNRTSAAGG